VLFSFIYILLELEHGDGSETDQEPDSGRDTAVVVVVVVFVVFVVPAVDSDCLELQQGYDVCVACFVGPTSRNGNASCLRQIWYSFAAMEWEPYLQAMEGTGKD
jgi:hypothetical protein